jgi:hypothetical protein
MSSISARPAQPSALDRAAIATCAVWIFILISSGVIERQVLVLHLLQWTIYGAAIALLARGSKWGYGIAISIALIWDFGNLHTGFIFDAGFREWRTFLRTGRIVRFVPWEATIGWFAHLALIGLCVSAWWRRPDRRARDAAGLAVSFAATYVYFGALLYFFGRPFFSRYLHLFLP